MLTEKQLEIRRSGITGTDIAAIMGLSRFRSPLDVFLDKMGEGSPVVITPDIERGIYLEPGIREWYKARVGATMVLEVGTVVHPKNPRIIATPDGLASFLDPVVSDLIPDRALEIKAPGRYAEDGWGEPGTDEVPAPYLTQGIWEMAVLDVERVDFAALLRGELVIYHVHRDREVEGLLFERAEKFWRDHVEARVAPAPSGTDRDAEWLKKRFPKDNGVYRKWEELSPEAQFLVGEYRHAHRDAKAAETALEQRAQALKLLIGEAAGLETPWGRIHWKKQKDGLKTDWEAVAFGLRNRLADALEKPGMRQGEAMESATAALTHYAEECTEPTEGKRPLLPKWKGEE